METTTHTHSSTVAVTTPMSGECFIPEMFGENLAITVASLDFARVWGGHGNKQMTAQELRTAANYARALANQADSFAASLEA